MFTDGGRTPGQSPRPPATALHSHRLPVGAPRDEAGIDIVEPLTVDLAAVLGEFEVLAASLFGHPSAEIDDEVVATVREDVPHHATPIVPYRSRKAMTGSVRSRARWDLPVGRRSNIDWGCRRKATKRGETMGGSAGFGQVRAVIAPGGGASGPSRSPRGAERPAVPRRR